MYSGSINKLSGNSKTIYEIVIQISDQVRGLEEGQAKQIMLYEKLLEKVDSIGYEMAVDNKLVDIDDFIPFKSVQDILQFCSGEDGLLTHKKEALRKRLQAFANQSSLSGFATSIKSALFENSPLFGTLKWPYKK